MAIAKVLLNNATQMDTTQVTVTASDLASGITALGKDGTLITGTASSGLTLIGSGSYTYSDSASATITFPVTYTGTPIILFASKDEQDTGVGETLDALRIITTGIQTVDNEFMYGVCAYKIKSNADVINYVGTSPSNANCIYLCTSSGAYQADGNYMRVTRYGNANLMQPGTYSWYIYG